MRPGKIFGWALLCVGLGASQTASAASLWFTGTFTQDDQLEIFSFVADSTTAVMRTWSFAGGINANGDTISPGGFDPVLSLFGPDSSLVATTPLLRFVNDGAGVPADPGSGEHFDSLIDTSSPPLVLIPGDTYFLVLSVSDNVPLTNFYGGGFTHQGEGNFTSIYGCGTDPFCDIDVDQRDGHWAVDITGVVSAIDISNPVGAVPEPSTFGMFGMAGALGLSLRKMLARRK